VRLGEAVYPSIIRLKFAGRHLPPIRERTRFLTHDLTDAANPHTFSHTLSMGRESMGRGSGGRESTGNDARKTELVPGTPETLIPGILERNARPLRGYGIAGVR
jgi:hypothetical protein